MKPRILVDGRMIGPRPHGIGEYVSDLARAAESSSLPFALEFLVSPHLPKNSPLRSFRLHETSLAFLHPLEFFRLPKVVDAIGAHLFHCTSFASPGALKTPFVQTVHDLNHLHYGGWKEKLYYELLLRSACGRAKRVASVSQWASAELEAWLHWPSGSIAVIPNAVEVATPAPHTEAMGALNEGPFLFALGHEKAHKNFSFLLESFEEARARQGGLRMVVAGQKRSNSSGVTFLPPLSREELAVAFERASAFLWPSSYEGFGRPPVEAAFFGTPVIASDIPVHREVLQGYSAVRFLPLHRKDLWSEALAVALSLPRVSPWRPQRFTLDAFLRNHLSFYGSVLPMEG